MSPTPMPPNRSSGEKQTTPVWPRLSYSARFWGSLRTAQPSAFSLNRAVLALGFLAALLILFGVLLRVIDHALLFGHWKPRRPGDFGSIVIAGLPCPWQVDRLLSDLLSIPMQRWN
jgi:hypothetical protein